MASTLLTGLLAGWRLDEPSGDRADVLGVATLSEEGDLPVGAGAGVVGRAARFDTVAPGSGVLSRPAAVAAGLPLTFAAWVWPELFYGVADWISVTRAGGAVARPGLSTWPQDEGLNPGYEQLGHAVFSIGSLSTIRWPIPKQEWSHVVCTHDGTTGRLYVGGELRAQADVVSTMTLLARTLVGGNLEASGGPGQGLLDEAYIWGRALSDGEVAELYDAGLSGLSYPWGPEPVARDGLAGATAPARAASGGTSAAVGLGGRVKDAVAVAGMRSAAGLAGVRLAEPALGGRAAGGVNLTGGV